MHEVHVLHDLVNPARLKNIDLTIGEGLNVKAGVVVEGILIFIVKLGSNIRDFLVDLCVAWGSKDAIILVDDEYELSSIEHEVVHTGF